MSSLPTFFWPKRVTWLAMMNFKKEEVQVHCVPGLRRGDSQRTALPDNEKQRKGSKEVNLTTD